MGETASITQEKEQRLDGEHSGPDTSGPDTSGPEALEPETDDDAFHEGNIPQWRFWILAAGICLGLGMSLMDASIVATALYSIGKDFQESSSTLNWVALAYTLAFLGCAVVFSRMADIVGRRNAFLAGFVIFFAFSLGCGFANNLAQLIACRALQGIGGSGLFSVAMIILPEVASQKLRQVIAGLVGLVIAVAGVLGPVLGGVLTQYASWRWVFWINGPIGVVSMALFYFAWPPKDQLPNTQHRPLKSLDVVGSVVVIAAAVLVTFSFQSVGTSIVSNPWQTAMFLAPFIVGVICWIALFAWSYVVDKHWAGRLLPAVPFVVFRNRIYTAGVLNTLLMGFPYFMTLYVFPLRAQVVNSLSPLDAGLTLLPMLGAAAVGTVAGGIINRKRNFIAETMMVAGCLMMIGLALETTLDTDPSTSSTLQKKSLGFLPFIGLGFGLSASASTMVAIVESPIREYAAAQGIIGQLRILGGSIGIAASSAILANKEKSLFGSIPALHSGGSSDGDPPPPIPAAIRQAFAEAFKLDMEVGAIVAGIAILFAAAMWRREHLSIVEMREKQIRDETALRRAAKASALRGSAV